MNDLPSVSKRIGNRWQFAIEFEVRGIPSRTGSWGYLWLWADGCLVGRPWEFEMIEIGLDSLGSAAAIQDRLSATQFLSTLSSREALNAVIDAHYGPSSEADSRTPRFPGDKLVDLEILPSQTGPFFDGWQAILLDDGKTERFIYRQEGQSDPIECSWPSGTFAAVVAESRSQFEAFVRSFPSA